MKEACSLLGTISIVTRERMVPFLREIFPTLLDVSGSGNKVCAKYCSECIGIITSNTVIKGTVLRLLVDTVGSSKNAKVRATCLQATKTTLTHWGPYHEKNDVLLLEKAIRSGVNDASATCRKIGYDCFLLYQERYPKRAALLISSLDYKIQKRLESCSISDKISQVKDSFETSSMASRNTRDLDDADSVGLAATVIEDTPNNFKVGDRVYIPDKNLNGYIRYIGEINAAKGTWIGIELSQPGGKNDGSIKGQRYFQCPANYGLFTKPSQLVLVVPPSQESRSPKSETASDEVGSPSSAKDPEPENPLMTLFNEASVEHRTFLNTLLKNIREEMEELHLFNNSASTASSADAVNYFQQVYNATQEKINMCQAFLTQVEKAQQKARES